MKILSIILICLTFIACEDDVLIKPKAMLSLSYEKPDYKKTKLDCQYQFEKNNQATLFVNDRCEAKINYPNNKATVFLTYRSVTPEKLSAYIFEAKKLAYSHREKALSITEQEYVNPDKKIYGAFFPINGNTASHAQFYVTDSTKHFLTGSLYFGVTPNFDSLYPSIAYIRNDMRLLMETITWQEE